MTERASSPPEVLFADDDEAMRSVVHDVLASEGFRVVLAEDGDQALESLAGRLPDVIVTDLRMPTGGLDFIARLRRAAPGVPIILITAFGDAATQSSARSLGVAAYISKPMRMAELEATIRSVVRPGLERTETS